MPDMHDAPTTARLDRVTDAIQAVFLHAGWRTCGTWLWEALRESAGVRAYYEPLHEDLHTLDRAALARFSPASWDSGHSPGAPYFNEYAPALRRSGRGIAGYDPRFAFDDFFRDPGDDDPALRAYLAGLIESARAEGRIPVLKFCRSLGRVPWLARHFPHALHAVVLRDPVAQFLSARRQMTHGGNRYFIVSPFIILARNASHPLLADAIARLGVKLPPHVSRDLGITRLVCTHHVGRLTWAERYRGFMALWIATAVTALRAGVTIIDSERLGGDASHRTEVQHALADRLGLEADLFDGYRPAPGAGWAGTDADAQDAMRAAFAALDFVAAQRATLPPAHARLLVRKLRPTHAAPLIRAALPPPQPPRPARAWLDAVAYVAAAWMTHPLRRTHFYYREWFPKKT
jgi:hypothetical protein